MLILLIVVLVLLFGGGGGYYYGRGAEWGAALRGRLARSGVDYPVDPLVHGQHGRWHDAPLETLGREHSTESPSFTREGTR